MPVNKDIPDSEDSHALIAINSSSELGINNRDQLERLMEALKRAVNEKQIASFKEWYELITKINERLPELMNLAHQFGCRDTIAEQIEKLNRDQPAKYGIQIGEDRQLGAGSQMPLTFLQRGFQVAKALLGIKNKNNGPELPLRQKSPPALKERQSLQ